MPGQEEKPEETLVQAHSGSYVEIDSNTTEKFVSFVVVQTLQIR